MERQLSCFRRHPERHCQAIYYVCTPDNAPEKIVGGFAFIIGREPNYAVIENGAWHSDQPYGTIHRIASNGQTKGIAEPALISVITK